MIVYPNSDKLNANTRGHFVPYLLLTRPECFHKVRMFSA